MQNVIILKMMGDAFLMQKLYGSSMMDLGGEKNYQLL